MKKLLLIVLALSAYGQATINAPAVTLDATVVTAVLLEPCGVLETPRGSFYYSAGVA